MAKQTTDLSVIITAHAEGIILHQTIAAVRRAIEPLTAQSVRTEIIIHCDNPSPETKAYINRHKSALADTRIFTNSFGNASSSRNFAVREATGRYVAFIDGDDLMSGNWLHDAYAFLEQHDYGTYVAHAESTVEFGALDALVIRHGEINQPTDTLLSAFANRWNAIIVAPRQLLLDIPYIAVTPGYGYEDWSMNNSFIARGIHNVLIPHTAIFIRRKEENSKWNEQRSAKAVLPATELLSFSNVRSLTMETSRKATDEPSDEPVAVMPQSTIQKLKHHAMPLLQRVPLAERAARKLYATARAGVQTIQLETAGGSHVPAWLEKEWRAMHRIERQLFPSADLMRTIPVYDSITPDHYSVGQAYKQLVDSTRYNHYDYIMFVPWFTRGGADRYALAYINSLQEARPKARIMVLGTLPVESVWKDKLDKRIDFIEFAAITGTVTEDGKFRLLEQLIENSGAQYIHILNSALGYDFVRSHASYMQATNKHLILTSFSQSTDDTGRVFGYSHTHVPFVYDLAEAITSDNQAVLTMWEQDYGFDPKKLSLHKQRAEMPQLAPHEPKDGTLRVLWAARLCPEKQPALVKTIGEMVKDHSITIDMYGQIDPDFDTSFLQHLPTNVTYKGAYDDYFALPLNRYDAYLYTSLFDGMPNAVLEAAAAQLPIVSSAVGGVPEFIEDGKTGLLVHDLENPKPYVDHLVHLLQKPADARAYGKAVYEYLSREYSAEAYKKRLDSFLKSINF